MLDIDIAQRVQVKFIPLGNTRWWSWVGLKRVVTHPWRRHMTSLMPILVFGSPTAQSDRDVWV